MCAALYEPVDLIPGFPESDDSICLNLLGRLLAQEASAVTYDWDTDTLFVVGDGGTSVVQLSKTDGHLINSMTLAPGPSPQGTDFYDTDFPVLF